MPTRTPLKIDIRDQRLPGGRLSLSARTTRVGERRERERAIRTLLDMGRLDVIRQVKEGRLHIAEVTLAVSEDRVDKIRRTAAPGDVTLGQAVDRFLRTAEATLSKHTLVQYDVIARLLLRHFGEDEPLSEIGTERAEGWLHEPKPRNAKGSAARPWSPRRQKLAAAVASRIWKIAIEDETERAIREGKEPSVQLNPWRKVSLPKVRATRVEFLRPNEWDTLLATVRGRPQAAWLAIACLAGLRLSEVRYLRTGVDVDLAARLIHVQPRDGEHGWQTKSDNSVRDVPIPDRLLEILSEHAALFAGERFFIIQPGKDEPLNRHTARDWTIRAFRAAGIRYGREGDALTYHSLRHTFASWLCQANVQLKIIAELLGDTTEVVDKTYAHLLPHNLREAVGAIDQTLGRLSAETHTANGKSGVNA